MFQLEGEVVEFFPQVEVLYLNYEYLFLFAHEDVLELVEEVAGEGGKIFLVRLEFEVDELLQLRERTHHVVHP